MRERLGNKHQNVRAAARVIAIALAVGVGLFLLENSVCGALAFFGYGAVQAGWAPWVRNLLLHVVVGLAAGLVPALLAYFKLHDASHRILLERLVVWSTFVIYAANLVLFRLPRVLGPASLLQAAVPLGLVVSYFGWLLFKSSRLRLVGVFDWAAVAGLLFAASYVPVRIQALHGSPFSPRVASSLALLFAGCMITAATLGRLRALNGGRCLLMSGSRREIFLKWGGFVACSFLLVALGRGSASLWRGTARAYQPTQRHDARKDVVLVVIDTLRRDRLGCYGYPDARTPNLDAIAAASTLYWDHVSAAPWTYPSVVSILTGLSPSAHGGQLEVRTAAKGRAGLVRRWPRVFRQNASTLGSILKAKGYETGFIATNPWLSKDLGFNVGWDHVEVPLSANLGAFTASLGEFMGDVPTLDAEEMTDRFLAYLQRPRESPVLLVAHYMDPHDPYIPPARFRTGTVKGHLAEAKMGHQSALYDGEVAFVDEQLGRLWAYLARTGRLERTVVAVTSDHGENFMDHGTWLPSDRPPDSFDPAASQGFGHGQTMYQELIRVPFLLYVPGQSPGIYTRMSRAIDVLPTILDALGVPSPEGLEGEAIGRSSTPPPALSEATCLGTEKKSWREGVFKLIFKPGYPPGRTFELYNLVEDPGERRDLAGADPNRVAAMAAHLECYLASLGPVDLQGPQPLRDPETLSLLRSLGYLQ